MARSRTNAVNTADRAEGPAEPNSPDFRIRRALDDDIPAIQRIAADTWADTYNNVIPPDVQAKVLAKAYSRESLAVSVSRDQAFLVAELGGALVGYADMGFDGAKLTLHRLYVLPACQGSGLGRALLSAAVASFAPGFIPPNERWIGNVTATPTSVDAPPETRTLVLTAHVERDNPKARAFYAKMGFSEDKEEIAVIGGITLPLIRVSVRLLLKE